MKTRIKVTRIWQQGFSRQIRLGEYEIDDNRLFGKGQYLVDNGFAHIIDPEKPKQPKSTKAKSKPISKPKVSKGDK